MIKDMFSNSENVSMMRICLLLCVLCVIAISVTCVVLDRDLTKCAWLATSILTPAFIGKAAQSFSGGNNVNPPIN